jgi:ClpP class serine protease
MTTRTTSPAPHLELLAVRDGAENDPGSVGEQRQGQVAVISLRGVLSGDVQPFSPIDAFGGDAMSLRGVEALARAADSDPDVVLVAFDLDGNGTRGARVFETAAVIRDLKTPTAAFVTSAFSGFAILAQATNRVAGTPMSEVGSINIQLGFRERLEDDGLRVISPSQLKADAAVGDFSAAVKKDMRNRTSRAMEAMRAFVGEARGLDDEALDEAFSGRTFVGQQAVDAGLLDGVFPTMDAFLASLQQEEETMPDKLDAAPPPAAAQEPQSRVAAAAAPDLTDAERSLIGRFTDWVTGSGKPAAASLPEVKVDGPMPAVKPPAPGLEEQVAAMAAKIDAQAAAMERLTAQAAAADHEALVARVKACAGLPAALVDGQVSAVEAMRAAGQHEAAEKLVAGLEAAAPPPRFAPGAFGDLGAPADVGVRMGDPVPESCTVDREEEAKVAAIMAEHKDDPEAARQALLELAGEVR